MPSAKPRYRSRNWRTIGERNDTGEWAWSKMADAEPTDEPVLVNVGALQTALVGALSAAFGFPAQ